jgi:hypothetical protein
LNRPRREAGTESRVITNTKLSSHYQVRGGEERIPTDRRHEKNIVEGDLSVCYDGTFQGWFHKGYITQEEFNVLKSMNCSLVWSCKALQPEEPDKTRRGHRSCAVGRTE